MERAEKHNEKKLVNPLPNDEFLDRCKLKPFAGDKINVTEKWKFVLGKVKKILGKRENAGYRYFSFSHNVFRRLLFPGH